RVAADQIDRRSRRWRTDGQIRMEQIADRSRTKKTRNAALRLQRETVWNGGHAEEFVPEAVGDRQVAVESPLVLAIEAGIALLVRASADRAGDESGRWGRHIEKLRPARQ